MGNEYFDPSHDNRLARCVELELSEGQGTDHQQLTLLAEVRCGLGRVVSERFTATIGLSEIELALDIDGGQISARSRLAERFRAVEERFDTKTTVSDITEVDTRIGGGLVGGVGRAIVSGSIEGSARGAFKHQTKTARQKELVETNVNRRVQAMGDNTWIIRETNGDVLDGTYLRDEALCRIESSGSIKRVRALVLVAKRHVKVMDVTNNESGTVMRISNNRRKILQILAAHTLGEKGDLIQISESSLVARNA